MNARATTTGSQHDHRAFLNTYYGVSRWFYDASRKYYLFGRDRALAQLAREPWRRLVEVGPGTGRNLRHLHRLRPDADLGGIEASDAMLAYAARRCPFATLQQGFAEVADYGVLGGRPDRILFSYALSMFQQPEAALAHARAQLAPGGELIVVDFSDLEALPGPAAAGLREWLRAFHVEPVTDALLTRFDAQLEHGPGRYFVIGRIRAEPATRRPVDSSPTAP